MRIALFADTYVPQRNGVALILDRLVHHLSNCGHDVLVAAPEPGRTRDPATGNPAAKLVRVPGFPLPRYPDLTVAIPFSREVGRAIRAFNPDVVHLVTEYSMGLTGLRAARRLGKPLVASFHTNIPRYLPYYGFGWASGACWRYLRWFHNKCSCSFCPSETTRAILLDRGFANVRIWGRGVDIERFTPTHRCETTRREHGPAEAVHLLYVGRLTPEKDLPVLFEAYRQASHRASTRPVHLLLAGDGAYSARMQARAPQGVTFLGHLNGDALSRAFASADCFVFPSRTETLGNVVLEALASGLPVIGAAEGGTMENVRDGLNGLLCTPGSASSFADGILRIAADSALRSKLAHNARAWAEQRTWDTAFQPLIAGYEEATAR